MSGSLTIADDERVTKNELDYFCIHSRIRLVRVTNCNTRKKIYEMNVYPLQAAPCSAPCSAPHSQN
ncbi:hypothetical protein BpHYR1_038357 [Brachionus plicatilis]|uniref:Uncharacterized protein n=1 Tax=Brachionus plicatilis TaxID=10195 RepID=A0A3M7REE9_BRAPC|nr:hypothetical protein BpHYR1_038357 [Brachionus plicatilis]